MKKIPIWILIINMAFILINSSATYAQGDLPNNPHITFPSEDFIQRYDKNGDGKITKTEFPSNEEDWDFLDADKDGFINIDEAREGQDSQIIHFFVPTEGNQ